MKATVKIPSPLRHFTGSQSQLTLEAATVQEALDQLLIQCPQLRPQLLDDDGHLRNFVNLYLNKVDIREQQGLATALQDNCELRIVPAIAGGEELPLLKPDELIRYSRHLTLPEVGIAGQQKLKAAKILIVGAGGLGSPLCLYLAAAGIGSLGIIDYDQVDESNLQRQILFGVSDLGESKARRAAARIRDLNPFTEVRTYEQALKADNALDIIADYDLVIDGTDNFPTRYLVNDACVLLDKPNIYGSIFRFDGQASVFHYDGGPCYRCLYPEPPPPGMVPSCAEGGVLGVLPAIIASIQATEAIKITTGIGEVLSGRLLLYDALQMRFDELQVRRKTTCSLCGDKPSITELIDYETFCGIPPTPARVPWGEISVGELKSRLENEESLTIVDVREPYEWEICHLATARLIPVNDFANHLHEFDPDQEIILHCKSGSRSAQVCQFLLDQGFARPVNLQGGILAWAREIDPAMKQY